MTVVIFTTYSVINDGSSQMAAARLLDEGSDATTGILQRGQRTTGTARVRGSGRGAGLALGLVSALLFGTSGTFGSALITAGWSPAGAVLARVLVAAVALSGPALLSLRGQWATLRLSWRQVLAYGMIGVAACQVCYFNAISHMPVGVAILLEYLGIVLIVLWLWVRHGQRPRPLTVAGGVASLGGLALMLDLSGSGPGAVSWIGVLWAMGAAVAMAIYFFQSAVTSVPSSPQTADVTGDATTGDATTGEAGGPPRVAALPPVVLTWGGMVVGAAFLAVIGGSGAMPLRMSAADVALFGHQVSWAVPVLGLGILAAAIAYVTGIGAVRRLGAKLGSFVALAEVLFAAGFAWVLLGQVPTATQFLGGLLILAGVVLVRLDEP
jgi:drug/metabolite transporter (DMT)-like permease